jgi:hypothetical protein
MISIDSIAGHIKGANLRFAPLAASMIFCVYWVTAYEQPQGSKVSTEPTWENAALANGKSAKDPAANALRRSEAESIFSKSLNHIFEIDLSNRSQVAYAGIEIMKGIACINRSVDPINAKIVMRNIVDANINTMEKQSKYEEFGHVLTDTPTPVDLSKIECKK